MRQDDQTVSCEISYLPLSGTTNDSIDKILRLITDSDVDYEIGCCRTILRGSTDSVFGLIKRLYAKADSLGSFVIDVRLSNTCGR